jgi:hypothetical protein
MVRRRLGAKRSREQQQKAEYPHTN